MPKFLLAEMGSLKLFCLGWPPTAILLISSSHVARITGVSHHTQLSDLFFFEIFFPNLKI
jgi:hypothetical protein